MVFGSPNASLLTGKLVLNQGFPSRSGDLVHFGRGTREGYRVRVERRDFARLLAHSRIKETGCRRQTRSESLGVEQSECRFASSREVEGSGPVGEGLDWGISSDRAGEGRGLAELCRSLGIHASAILVLFDHVHGDACPLSDYLQARFLHAQYHGICLWHIGGYGGVGGDFAGGGGGGVLVADPGGFVRGGVLGVRPVV